MSMSAAAYPERYTTKVNMRRRYESAWWSIEMPPGWEAEYDETCVALTCEDGVGALQFSAYQRDDGTVTDDDLREFAEDDQAAGAGFRTVALGDFLGLAMESVMDESFWQKWWLRKGPLMLYVTYNCKVADKGRERAVVTNILSTLKYKLGARAV